MVVSNEFIPSQKDFIVDYIAKRRKQLEILKESKSKLPVVLQGPDLIMPLSLIDEYMKMEDVNRLSAGQEMKKTAEKIPTKCTREPQYVKNFRKFMRQTQRHLEQVLANNQRIEDIHDIVKEIQKPIPHLQPIATFAEIHSEYDEQETLDEVENLEGSSGETSTPEEELYCTKKQDDSLIISHKQLLGNKSKNGTANPDPQWLLSTNKCAKANQMRTFSNAQKNLTKPKSREYFPQNTAKRINPHYIINKGAIAADKEDLPKPFNLVKSRRDQLYSPRSTRNEKRKGSNQLPPITSNSARGSDVKRSYSLVTGRSNGQISNFKSTKKISCTNSSIKERRLQEIPVAIINL